MPTATQTSPKPPSAVHLPGQPSLLGLALVDLGYALAFPFVMPYLLWCMAVKGKHRHSLWGQWGIGLARATRGFQGPSIWVHAVSVGEVRAAVPVVRRLRERFPDDRIVITTTTETGQSTAREIFGDDLVWWYPWDFSFIIARWFRALRPRLVIIMEVDLWPNFVRIAARRGVPVAVVNGKLSDKTHRRYGRLMRLGMKTLVHRMWQRVSALCVQTDLDRDRFLPLAADPAIVHVTGNVKFDFATPEISDADRRGWRDRMGLRDGQPVIVVGSTHRSEEALALDAFARVRARHPDAHLILVPRHPERFDEVAGLVEHSPFSGQRWSQARGEGADITVVDEMGLLQGLYSLATVAVVAGSFVPVGGHNILEPAQFGVPVLFGPHMHAQRGMRRVILRADAGIQISECDGEMLARTLMDLLADPDRRRRMGECGIRAVEESRGSAERSVEIVGALIR
ncbi:3-deoxy-D-manno-octulosonic acid transferase [Candidatus Sumerlaeota bacterium]|nr:3-deoxy-D-manno-octulosonic acid transferase [Candidatus Sumerlaeota bacterium]